MSAGTPSPDSSGGYYRTRLRYHAGRDRVWRVICRHLQRYVARDATVLDIGAGYCSFINHIDGAHKHAIDVYPDFVRHAASDVSARVGDCRWLSGFDPASIDVVFASNLLEHLTHDDVAGTLLEVRRVLVPGGRLILVQPNFRLCPRQYFDDYTHRTVFTDVALADCVAAAGFDIETVMPRFMPLTLKGRLPQWGWLVNLYFWSPIRPLAKQMLVVARRAEHAGVDAPSVG